MPILVGLLATTTLYAALLSTGWGQEWAQEQTWSTVALGVLLVAGWMAFEDPVGASKTLVFFCVGGAPMVVRSLILQFLRYRRLVRRAMETD